MNQTDVVIIGAGLSGLLACKYLRASKMDCIVLESTDDIGGVWKYRERAEREGRGYVVHSVDFIKDGE